MKITLTALAFVVTALATPTPQGVYSVVTLESAAPSGCSTSYQGAFQITVKDVDSTGYKRDVQKRAEGLTLTLADGVLLDSSKRTGYIASNYQFQFDGPPQVGAIYTAGFSICSNNSLALGGSAIFYQCLSGSFYNLYDRDWAEQCSPIYIYAMSTGSGAVSVLPDGQPQAPTGVASVSSGYAPAYSSPSNYTWVPSSVAAKSVPMVTKTVYQTSLYTITSCAAEVTNCPARSTIIQTTLVAAYTTVCPATETPVNLAPGSSYPVASGSVPLPSAPALTVTTTVPLTKTIFQTQLITVTSCAADVTNCPARSTIVYTSVVPAYTTIVPSAPVVTGIAVSELTDGQIQAPTSAAPVPSAGTASPVSSAAVVTSVAPYASVPAVTGAPVMQITDGQIQVPVSSAAAAESPAVSYPQSFSASAVASSASLTSYAAVGTGSPNATANTGIPQFTGAASANTFSVGGVVLAGVAGLFAAL